MKLVTFLGKAQSTFTSFLLKIRKYLYTFCKDQNLKGFCRKEHNILNIESAVLHLGQVTVILILMMENSGPWRSLQVLLELIS